MNLRPGCRFAVAARFHLSVDWPGRLLVGTGVEEADGFFPRGPWRPPTGDELSHLVGEPKRPAAAEGSDGVVELFRLPEHLRTEWGHLLERAAPAAGGLPGYDAFVTRVVEFLAFKGLPVPDGVVCDAVVTRAGQRSIRCDAQTGRPLGMGGSLFPRTPWPTPETRVARLWGGINLGDEATSLVLVNLSYPQMDAELRRGSANRPAAATAGELTERFLRACPDYPPVRLTLQPGEGYRLPASGLVVDGSAEDKQEPDVLLLITEGGDRGPGVPLCTPEMVG